MLSLALINIIAASRHETPALLELYLHTCMIRFTFVGTIVGMIAVIAVVDRIESEHSAARRERSPTHSKY